MRMFKLNLQIFIQDESFWEGRGFGIKSESLYSVSLSTVKFLENTVNIVRTSIHIVALLSKISYER